MIVDIKIISNKVVDLALKYNLAIIAVMIITAIMVITIATIMAAAIVINAIGVIIKNAALYIIRKNASL